MGEGTNDGDCENVDMIVYEFSGCWGGLGRCGYDVDAVGSHLV